MVRKWFAVWLTVQTWFAHSPGINESKLTSASPTCSQGGSPEPIRLPPQNVGTACDSQTLHQNSQDKQPASSSEQMKNWLREGHKDMPWHNIDSVAVSDTQDNSNVSVAPSDTPATQGSDK
ncbi:hypothetical protein Forpe1208_v006812 [Fusarium oxysporum f. sp. rapae]|uniref:Uncharacterized protein n=1 Tax=Fusarium oxysporum f. sp. rapae TaxID=485398 RepID=A0A8J5PAA7_FUSOX|nr:hypothetical protein Forpe1208_v006812 [Fusarium oxysporum f. sp. rapae]